MVTPLKIAAQGFVENCSTQGTFHKHEKISIPSHIIDKGDGEYINQILIVSPGNLLMLTSSSMYTINSSAPIRWEKLATPFGSPAAACIAEDDHFFVAFKNKLIVKYSPKGDKLYSTKCSHGVDALVKSPEGTLVAISRTGEISFFSDENAQLSFRNYKKIDDTILNANISPSGKCVILDTYDHFLVLKISSRQICVRRKKEEGTTLHYGEDDHEVICFDLNGGRIAIDLIGDYQSKASKPTIVAEVNSCYHSSLFSRENSEFVALCTRNGLLKIVAYKTSPLALTGSVNTRISVKNAHVYKTHARKSKVIYADIEENCIHIFSYRRPLVARPPAN